MKKSVSLIASVAVAGIIFSGCSVKTASEYSISADNVVALRKFETAKIAVGAFGAQDPENNSVNCRGLPITTPEEEPFQEYIRNAFIQELKMANIYDKNSPIVLTGHLKKIDTYTMLGDAYWEIEANIASSNGKSFDVYIKRKYPYAFSGDIACDNAANAFQSSVRKLINDVVTHKDFSALIQK